MSRNITTISLASGDSASTWVRSQSQFEALSDAVPLSFSGNLTSGDTIIIDVSNDVDPNDTLETYLSSEAYATTNFGGTITGQWRFIRVRKTGSNGAATVKISI